MDGLQWKTLLKMDDLGMPLFLETSMMLCSHIILRSQYASSMPILIPMELGACGPGDGWNWPSTWPLDQV